MSHDEATHARFAATAAKMAELGEGRIAKTTEKLRRFARPRDDERALDVGTGTGTFALALAPLVREVVGVDVVPEMLEHARRLAEGVPNVSFTVADASALPFEDGSFDVVVSSRTIHHIEWPERALDEMMRVCRLRGRLLVIDQIASVDPLAALAHNRIEHLRDPSHVRVLSDQDFRSLFDANDLLLQRFELEKEDFELDRYLDLAGCEGEPRAEVYAEVERLLAIDQAGGIGLRRSREGYSLTLSVAWYLLEKVPAPPQTTAV